VDAAIIVKLAFVFGDEIELDVPLCSLSPRRSVSGYNLSPKWPRRIFVRRLPIETGLELRCLLPAAFYR
jgi:hypothetical protein